MNFGELVQETAARGFSDLLDGGTQETRLKRWVNDSHREICDEEDWPFLEATKEGTAPLEIEDLGHVLSASNITTELILEPLDRRRVVDGDPDLDETGSSRYWYREGMTSIKVWPADTSSTFVVRYIKAVELSEEKDEPLMPSVYHNLIVDGAVVRCLKNRHNYEAAQFVRQEWERGMNQMRHALLKANHDRPKRIIRTGLEGDYL